MFSVFHMENIDGRSSGCHTACQPSSPGRWQFAVRGCAIFELHSKSFLSNFWDAVQKERARYNTELFLKSDS